MSQKILNEQEFYDCIDEKIKNHELHNDSILSTACENYALYLDWYGKEGAQRLVNAFDKHFLIYAQRHACIIGHFRNDEYYVFGEFSDDDLEDIFDELQRGLYELEDVVPFRVDIGVYRIGDHTQLDTFNMCNKAMIAGYTASENEDRIHIFQNDILMDMRIKLQYSGDIKKAIEEDQFLVYFMPKVNSVTNALVGFEALIRWQHPLKGLLTPESFIPALENENLVTKLDYYVWDRVCKEIRNWAEEGNKIVPVSMNVSLVDVHSINVAKTIIDLVKKYQLDPSWIHVEITETVVSKNIDSIVSMINEFHEAGIKVEMDDFGSGFSSLNMLKEIPIDIIKTDMAFMDITEKNHDKARRIIQSVVEMAHMLDLPVIAEGVETKEQVSFLQTLDCIYMQGFYFSKPMSLEETKKYVSTKEICVLEEDYKQRMSAPSMFLTNMQLSDIIQTFDIVADFTTAFGLLNLNTGEYKIIKKNPRVQQEHVGSVIDLEKWRDILLSLDIIHSNSKELVKAKINLNYLRKRLFYAKKPVKLMVYKKIDSDYKWMNIEIIPCRNCSESNPWCTLVEVEADTQVNDIYDKTYEVSIDPLTKAFTRGKYQNDLSAIIYAGFKSLSVVYIDVIGLHEINNYTGHHAGDQMLVTVAKKAQDIFKESLVYRIGGDEFVILSPDIEKEETEEKVEDLKEALKKEDYYISTGVSYTTNLDTINSVIDEAENEMRIAKKSFYTKNAGRQERGLNLKLEKIINENNQLTSVLESLKFRYEGIYFVNTKTDTVQTILANDDIKKLLKENNNRFYQSMNYYIHHFIQEVYVASMMKLLDAEYVSQQLKEKDSIEYNYTSKLNNQVSVTIYRNVGKTNEYLWIYSRSM